MANQIQSSSITNFLYKWLLLVIGLAAYWFVFNKLISFNAWGNLLEYLHSNYHLFFGLVIIQLIFSAINIVIEAKKWHLLISNSIEQLFKISVVQVLAGCTVGTLTPSRLGEPVGRLIYIPKNKRLSAISLSYLGSFHQVFLIIIIGLVAFFFNDNSYIKLLVKKISLFKSGLFLSAILFIILLFIIKTVRYFIFNIFKKWKRQIFINFKSVSIEKWIRFYVLTVVKYIIFSAQVILWLYFFAPNVSIYDYLILVPVYYLLVTIIPSFIFTEIGIRGSIAIFIFGVVIENDMAIVSAIMLTWLINIGMPTLVGAFGYFRKK
ncbi:MAG: flippase-like domain-containing protein [Marinilabiliaceae bacterium]|nr:flippase-like domain-containing protein [Marinilabiliaceae bacterium]